MKKSTWGIIGGSLVLVLALAYYANQSGQMRNWWLIPATSPEPATIPTPVAVIVANPEPTNAPIETPDTSTLAATTPLNATYIINNQPVTLVNGKASTPAAPGSASMVTTTLWGTPATGNLNADTLVDQAVILTQNSGGSGDFYYVAAAVNQNGTYLGTNAELLGDRIAMQVMTIRPDKLIEANYAVRPEGAPMTAQPSEAVSSYFELDGMKLVPAQNPNVTGN